jgi:hypothetical protein
MLKRIAFLSALCGILGFALFTGERATTAEKPKGTTYYTNFSWEVNLDSSGTAIVYDTTTSTTGGGKIFYFRGLENYSTLNAAIYVEVTNLDSGEAAADVPDTSKDSMLVQTYAGYGGESWYRKIYQDSIMKAGSAGDTLYYNLSDSLGSADRVWFQFITSVADTDHTVCSALAGITYKATVRMTAK